MPSQINQRLRIILHADDLGISRQVNDQIFWLMDEGKITSASILANGPAFSDAVRRSHYFPNCSFGLHLNITEFEALHPSDGLRPLLSGAGTFQRTASRWHFSNHLKQAVLAEWTAQFQRLRQAGVEISHIDSHHHMHTRLPLLSCLQQFCTEHAIGRVRIRHTFNDRNGAPRWRIDNLLFNRLLRRQFTCAKEFGPFGGFASAQPHFSPGATVELMLHPGHPSYDHEVRALNQLMDHDFRQKHQCITYRELN